MDIIIDIVFMIDISLMFLTSYIDSKGIEITDSRMIAKHYVDQLRFKIDALAIFGSFVFTDIHHFFNFFGMFKVMRVFRVSTLIAQANVNTTYKAALKLMKLIFYLMFYLHLMACLRWMFVQYGQGKRYYPNYDYGYY